jgi:hypothetical protein
MIELEFCALTAAANAAATASFLSVPTMSEQRPFLVFFVSFSN